MIPLSAKNAERLRDYAGKLLAFLTNDLHALPSLAAMAYTLQTGREAMDERLLFLVRNLDELTTGLRGFLDGEQRAAQYWRGHAKQGSDLMGLFAADEELNGLFAQWVAGGKVDKIAELWTRGLPVDWASLYGPGRPFGPRLTASACPPIRLRKNAIGNPRSRRHILLPTAVRVVTNGAIGSLTGIHPLVHRNTSNLAELALLVHLHGPGIFSRRSSRQGAACIARLWPTWRWLVRRCTMP